MDRSGNDIYLDDSDGDRTPRRSVSFSKKLKGHLRRLSSASEKPLNLPTTASGNIALDTSESPRLAESPRITPRARTTDADKEDGGSKTARAAKHDLKNAPHPQTLAHFKQQQAQLAAIHEQLGKMATNMDSLYTVTTKQLERIRNDVDELGRTGRILHPSDAAERDTQTGSCCSLV